MFMFPLKNLARKGLTHRDSYKRRWIGQSWFRSSSVGLWGTYFNENQTKTQGFLIAENAFFRFVQGSVYVKRGETGDG